MKTENSSSNPQKQGINIYHVCLQTVTGEYGLRII